MAGPARTPTLVGMLLSVLGGLALVALIGLAFAVRVLKQNERGVQFRHGKMHGDARGPGLIQALAAGELSRASDVMMAHPLRNLQTMVEIGVDKNSTIVFPAPLMSTIGELGSFLTREIAASKPEREPPAPTAPLGQAAATNGDPAPELVR